MSVPLPAAVAAALVLAIGLALTATLASFSAVERVTAPAFVPTSSLDVARPVAAPPARPAAAAHTPSLVGGSPPRDAPLI